MGGGDRLSEEEFAVDFRVKFSVVSLACAGFDWTEWGHLQPMISWLWISMPQAITTLFNLCYSDLMKFSECSS